MHKYKDIVIIATYIINDQEKECLAHVCHDEEDAKRHLDSLKSTPTKEMQRELDKGAKNFKKKIIYDAWWHFGSLD